jgi:mannose-6-phosphate isomerase
MHFPSTTAKKEVFKKVREFAELKGFSLTVTDDSRPWGGFYYIDEKQAPQFIATFFPHLSLDDFTGFSKLSPKLLIVEPKKRLSWQYHHRRSEIWKVIGGTAGIVTSESDDESSEVRQLSEGTIVNLEQGVRHRLLGLEDWAVVAEIWQHTDPANPSDEDDIVRVQDDFGR